jgi:hypothetical protein
MPVHDDDRFLDEVLRLKVLRIAKSRVDYQRRPIGRGLASKLRRGAPRTNIARRPKGS